MSDDDTLSDAQLRPVLFTSTMCIFLNTAAAALSFTVIHKFTAKQMTDMKFHLLNIAACVYFSDIMWDIFALPAPIYPYLGICGVSNMGILLTRWMGTGPAFRLLVYIQVIPLGCAAWSVCNATFHRYYTSKHAGSASQGVPRKIVALMVIGQFIVVPLGCYPLTTIKDTAPDLIEEIKKDRPQLFERIQNRPCLFYRSFTNLFEENPLFDFGVIVAGVFCTYCIMGTAVYAFFSWRALFGLNLSERATKMRKNLIVSFLLQSFLPYGALGFGAVVALGVLWFQPPQVSLFVIFMQIIYGMHSVLNCAAMCLSIPAYRRGLLAIILRPWRVMGPTTLNSATDRISAVDSSKKPWFYRRQAFTGIRGYLHSKG